MNCRTLLSVIVIFAVGPAVGWLVAQESDNSIESPIPDITITAEDPLTLLPPLGPPLSTSPTVTLDSLLDRATMSDVPTRSESSSKLSPLPQFALDKARFINAMERSTNIFLNTTVDDLFAPRKVRVDGSIERRDQESELDLGLNGIIPFFGDEASQFSVRGGFSLDERRVGLGLTVTADSLRRVMNAYLRSFGTVETELLYFGGGITETWHSYAALRMQLGISRQKGLPFEALIGGSIQVIEGQASLLPSGKLTYRSDDEWWLQLEIQPYHAYPLWLDSWLKASSELLPQNAWQASVIGGFKDMYLRIGIAGGLMYKIDFPKDTIAVSTHDTTKIQVEVVGNVDLGAGSPGPIELNTIAGLTWSWQDELSGKILIDIVWPVVERPPLSILFQGGVRWPPLYGIDNWHNSFDRFGSFFATGLRWIFSYGNRLQLLSGIHIQQDQDLTQFIRIEYVRSTMSLITPPEKKSQ